MSLTTNNSKIISFYNKNKHLNFESVNLLLVDFLENLCIDKNFDDSSINKILNKLTTQETMLKNITDVNALSRENEKSQIDNLKEKLSNVTTEIVSNLKEVLTNNLYKTINNEHIDSTLNNIVDKTKLMLNETIQNNVSSMINNSEKRISDNLKNINDTSIQNKITIDNIKNEISEHFTSLSNSSKKGKIGENKLYSLLTNLYPSGEIVNNTDIEKCSGDFFLRRKNKSQILFENKDYSTNVGPSEIDKFIRDIDIHHSHGIFLSQQTGITLKENYEIDIHKNKILIYLHNVNYNSDIIKSAVEIIDTLETFIEQQESEDHVISNTDLNEINLEFKRFIQERQECIQFVQDSQKKMVTMLQRMNLNFLEKYLSTKFAYVQNSNFVCPNCNKCWPTKRALSSHLKACKTVKTIQTENTITIET
jgi:hypothetical protein